MDKFLIKQKVKELISTIYGKYSNVGGELHIVLDDGNIGDENIQWCFR